MTADPRCTCRRLPGGGSGWNSDCPVHGEVAVATPSSNQRVRPTMTPQKSRKEYIQELARYLEVDVPKHIFAPTRELEALLERYADAVDAAQRPAVETTGDGPWPDDLAGDNGRYIQILSLLRRGGHELEARLVDNALREAIHALKERKAPYGPMSVYRDHMENRASSVPGCDCAICDSRRAAEKTAADYAHEKCEHGIPRQFCTAVHPSDTRNG